MPVRLQADCDLIVSTLAGSTTHRASEVAALVLDALQARCRRVAGGQAAAQQRHEEMRGRIIAAAGAMDVDPTLRGWAAAVQRRITKAPARYGFETIPDLRTITKARDYLLHESGTTIPSCTIGDAIAPQTSASST